MRLVLPSLLLLVGVASAEEVLVREAPASDSCDEPWVLQGKVTVGEVLREMSRKYCAKFFVPQEVLAKKINLAVAPTTDPHRMTERLRAALVAAGLDVDIDVIYSVREPKSDEVPLLLPLTPPDDSVIDPDFNKEVVCKNDRCEVSRWLLTKLAEDFPAVGKQARFVPLLYDGKPIGWKVYAVRQNSLFWKLGLRNNDTILAVNDVDINTPDAARNAYAQWRTAPSLKLSLDRRGQPMTLLVVVK